MHKLLKRFRMVAQPQDFGSQFFPFLLHLVELALQAKHLGMFLTVHQPAMLRGNQIPGHINEQGQGQAPAQPANSLFQSLSLGKCIPAGIAGRSTKLLFDTQQLIVLGHTIRTRSGT